MNTETYQIVNGPGRDTLFDACKYAYSDVKLYANFTVALGYTMPPNDPSAAYIPMTLKEVKVIGIEHENGSGHSFNLYGYCKANLSVIGMQEKTPCNTYKFMAYYNAKTRKGTIRFE